MRALVVEWKEYDLKPVDIDAITEEECQLAMDEHLMPGFKFRQWLRNPYSFVVLTFSGPDLPIGTVFSLGLGDPAWRVFAENKAYCRVRFNTDEYGHKATTKIKYRQWAENHGIKFGE